MTKDINNHQALIQRLKDDKEADAYFKAVLEKCKKLDEKEAEALLLEALKNLSEAHPDKANLGLSPETLSAQGNLKLSLVIRFLRFIAKKIA